MPEPETERRHSFVGLYDACLALTAGRKVVANSANADDKLICVITGANQGGKSTFLRSVGLAQLMMQCGMFVPAQAFGANVCDGIFTHYKREEDASMKSGKFDEELARMSAIADLLTPNSMVLFNESFAATNDREGSEIARQVVDALLEKNIKIFFVTHLYEFARAIYDDRTIRALFLRAPRQEDGTRSFKLIEGEPLDTSFGRDLYVEIFENGGERRTTATAGVAMAPDDHRVANAAGDDSPAPDDDPASITSTRQ
jgi:DNA mismatch repair ATPase MutS